MSNSAANRPAVTGTVSYREPIALPHDAVIEVSLLDVSLMDVAAKLISKQTITPEQSVPIPFKLHYDPQDIDQRMTYAVQARILDGEDKLLFVTDISYQVLTRGQPDRVDLVLKHIRH
jgi:putative lipoprotein